MRPKLCFLLFLLAPLAQAQYQHQAVFPTYTGSSLLDSLVLHYKPIIILDYDDARDTLYRNVYRYQDSVECVYSGHRLPLPLGIDPSTSLFSSGSSNGINAEHTYPQSKGARYGNAKSDMHHIFPTRTGTNSARSNFPLMTIPSGQATNWYYLTMSEINPSLAPILYSKRDSFAPAFEPRASHRGNAARAIFYFYTMYKDKADNADPTFFAQQLPSLCQWHLDDPVDSLEWERTFLIAAYQEGKANPFVLDCTLPQRTYCPHLSSSACYTALPTLADVGAALYPAYPNPASTQVTISYQVERPIQSTLTVLNSLGQVVWKQQQKVEAGLQQHSIACEHWPKGLYHYQLVVQQDGQQLSVGHSFVVQ